MAESSYAEIELYSNFFSSFAFNATLCQEDTNNFKVAMRSLVSVVKSPHSFDKSVETCLLCHEPGKSQLVVTIKYSKGTTKEYIIPHIEYESFEANFSKSDAKNYILSDACTLISATNQFKSGEDEITLSSGKENSVLENHLQNAKDCKTTVKTTVRVDHQYLETYTISFPTQITFCLKEFKALLTLSENVRLPIAFYYDTPGKPLILEVGEPNTFRINVLISTLQALQNDQQSTSQNLPECTESQRSSRTRTDDNPQTSVDVANTTESVPHCPENITRYQKQSIGVNKNVTVQNGNSECNSNNSQFFPSNPIPGGSQSGNNHVFQADAPDNNVQINPQNNVDLRTQNIDNAVNSCSYKNDKRDKSQKCSQTNFQTNLESIIPNNVLETDENRFSSGASQFDPPPVSSNLQTERAPSPPAKSYFSKRKESDVNHLLDIEAFVMSKNKGLNSSNPKINSCVNLEGSEFCHSLPNEIYFTVFKRCFNSSSSSKKNRSKILVYSSDALSDSD